ncbi:MAG: hypothetical protein B7Y45_03040 [Sphingomonas sp. 28-66-16]|nr:MAG: hypothetical protein B7Y45_03040 [Sphingomonas sp. 28-66-16]
MADPPPLPYQRVLLQGIDISANVRFVEVEDHDRLIDRAVVEVDDPAGLAREAPREGNTLVVELGWADTHAALFEGEITRVQTREAGCEVPRVRLTALDFASRIQKRPFEATNHTGTLSAIVRAIVTRTANVGVTVAQVEPAVDPNYTETAPLRQTQDDWAFITEQSRRAGCISFVEYNAERSQFYFVPLTGIMAAAPAGQLSNVGTSGRILSINLERSAGTADTRRSAASIDPATGDVRVSAAPPPPVETPSVPSARAIDTADRAGAPIDDAIAVAGEATETPATLRPTGLAVGARDGDAPQDPTLALGWRARGRCVGTVMLRAKSRIELTGVASWAETQWYVKRAKHVVVTPRPAEDMLASYVTEFELTR